MDGTIGFESEVGTGSTFWFEVELPIATAEVPTDTPARPTSGRVGRRLLLADDVALNRELAGEILRQAGHTVDMVVDGSAAVSAIRTGSYDLILMDVHMPVLDGISATRQVRALPGPESRTPIVAMTANVIPEQVAGFLAAGMDAHVGKPFRPGQLLDVIDRLTAPGEASRPSPSASDTLVLEDMRRAIGQERVYGMLAMLAEELKQRFPDAPSPARGQLAYDAHAMVAAAGAMGFNQLAQACREVETACNSGHDYGPAFATLLAVRGSTLTEIGTLLAA